MLNLPSSTFTRRHFAAALPFPHAVIPGAVDPQVARGIAAEYPPPGSTGWHTFTNPLEAGKQEGAATIAGPLTAALHWTLGADWFVRWLADVSGVPDLVADPSRHGGGIHQSGPGARLGMHVDFRLLPSDERLVRAVNLIVFLDDSGHEDDGGWLQLGADDGFRVRVRPEAGLLVVFASDDDSWHGHPVPLADHAPLRRSVPAYYYRPVRDGEQIEQHSTRFLADL